MGKFNGFPNGVNRMESTTELYLLVPETETSFAKHRNELITSRLFTFFIVLNLISCFQKKSRKISFHKGGQSNQKTKRAFETLARALIEP